MDEYVVKETPNTTSDISFVVQLAAEQGWAFVSGVLSQGGSHVNLIFRRPKQTEE